MKLSLSQSHMDHLFHQISWRELDEAALMELVIISKNEDMSGYGLLEKPTSPGDVSTALMDPSAMGEARLVARQTMVVAALPLVSLILNVYGDGCTFIPHKNDGDVVQPGESLGLLKGPVTVLLQAERIILNFLQHLSGVATETSRYARALEHWPTRILDTRKTTPGFRVLEKYAVACGGGWNHRMGLFDRVMLKDNHLAASASQEGQDLAQLVSRARREQPKLVVEVEVDALEQIPPVLTAGAHVILLDNFSYHDLKEAVKLIDGRALTEASGGITLENLNELGKIGLDFISSGALIHQSRWMDIGLDWQDS